MATAVSTVGAVNRVPLINGSSPGAAVPTSAFFGSSLKKVNVSIHGRAAASAPGSFRVVAADLDESKQTAQDRWGGLVTDISDDQQDITRGKGTVDPLFQAPTGDGTHEAVMSSYEYLSQGLREYGMDNTLDGLYIAPAFMDKLVVHITKNFMNLPNIKIPLILGVWGGKGQGKSFQCELVFRKMGIKTLVIDCTCTFSPFTPNFSCSMKPFTQDFFGALRARVYDDEVRKWVSDIGVEKVGKRLVNSLEGPPTFEQPKMTVEKLLQYGNMLVMEQENVKRVQLADKYLAESSLGEANEDAIKTGNFYGQAAQHVRITVPEGCTDPSAANYDPTARSDDGSCAYKF
ncbi:uncharacterized protein A4U43_C08F35510 [Asparagus officinalis]|nr:uncharacterized protein A4U43_C08F35510 [Asparagus officinalis]